MPLLWERVDNLSQLFMLLPVLEDPARELTENDFSRFNVYAFWIKHLEVRRDRRFLKYSQLEALCRYAEPRNLLPNITSINSHEPDVTCVLPFLSPSLLRLEHTSDRQPIENCELTKEDLSISLQNLSKKCSKLQTLEIYLDSDSDPEEEEEEDSTPEISTLEHGPGSNNKEKLRIHPGQCLAPFIATIPPLLSFTSSETVLPHSCFETISTWPLLESLSISLDPHKSKSTLPQLPDTAFPSLKNLTLHWLPSRKAFRMFWGAPTLVNKLKSVKILLSGNLCSEREHDGFKYILKSILRTLVERSPCLENLWLRALDPDAERAWYTVPLASLEVLKKVPLKQLYIEGVVLTTPVVSKKHKVKKNETERQDKGEHKIEDQNKDESEVGNEDKDEDRDEYDDESEDEEEDASVPPGERPSVEEHLITMFPELRELGFPSNELSFTDLPLFHSKLPHLEALRFDFSLTSLSTLPADLKSVPRHRKSPFRVLEANLLGMSESTRLMGISHVSYDRAALLVQYLFSLWPNVQIEPVQDTLEMDEYVAHRKAIVLINEHLTLLSYCNRDASMKYEDIKVLNKTSWDNCRK
ncbi:hypothetical protein FRC09_010924 [Ceratobasidium sp. 395]|nr:hypothetical protein FRC09_010924 [Ceratobasidium sp. 395]